MDKLRKGEGLILKNETVILCFAIPWLAMKIVGKDD